MKRSAVAVLSRSASEWTVFDEKETLTYRIAVDTVFKNQNTCDQTCVVYGTIVHIKQQGLRTSDGICAIRPDGSRVRIRFDGRIAYLESELRCLAR